MSDEGVNTYTGQWEPINQFIVGWSILPWYSCRITAGLFTSFLAVVVRGIELGVIIRYLDAGDHKVVLLIWRMGPQNQPVNGIVLPLWPAGVHEMDRILIYTTGHLLADRGPDPEPEAGPSSPFDVNGKSPANKRHPPKAGWVSGRGQGSASGGQ